MVQQQDPGGIPQISFKQELARKATHMGALIIPCGYFLFGLDKCTALTIMIPITLGMILIDISRLRNWVLWRKIGSRIIGPMVRHHEQRGDFTGASYILLSSCITIGLYAKPIAIASLAFIIVGDSFAAVIGRKWGKHRFGRKSIEGSLSCLFGCVLVALCGPYFNLPIFPIALAGAVLATIVEALSSKIDDNISVPLLTGLGMTLLQKMLL
jgi:dolichol kinase